MISYLAPKVTGAGPGDSHRHLKDSSVHADLHLMDLCMMKVFHILELENGRVPID